MDFFTNGFLQNGFFQKVDFSKIIFLNCIFQKCFFFSNFIFQLKLFGGTNVKNRSAARVLSCQEARKKGCAIFWQSFFWAGYAALYLRSWSIGFAALFIAQITAQRHEFDDHRGNDFDDRRSLKNLHRHSTFTIPGKPEFYDHQSFTARHWRRVGFKFRVDLIAKLTYELKYEFHFSAIMPSCPLATASLFASPLFASSATRMRVQGTSAVRCLPPRHHAVGAHDGAHDGWWCPRWCRWTDDGADDGADGRWLLAKPVAGGVPPPWIRI